MSADFPLKSDLPIEDQLEIDRIQAIDEDKRSQAEEAFLDSRAIYLVNEVITVSMKKGNRNPNAQSASNAITFTDVPAEGEIVTIGVDTYEFDDDDDTAEGNIAVDISGAETSGDARDLLGQAIENSGTEDISVDGDSDTLSIMANTPGMAGNQIAVSTTCLNASWDNDTLVGGQDAVLASQGEFFLNGDETALFFTFSGSDDPLGNGAWSQITFELS